MSNLRSLRIEGASFIWKGDVSILLNSKQGEVAQDVQRRAYAVQKRMKRLAPVRFGNLRKGIRVESTRESSAGPFSRVISDAPHTLVAEYGRRGVRASGLPGGGVRTRARGSQRASTRLVWGSDLDKSRRPNVLKFQPKRGSGFIYRSRVGPAEGSHFMERSIDAALN